MPAVASVPNAVRVQLEFNVGADLSVGAHVFLSYSGPPLLAADATALAIAANNAFDASLVPNMSGANAYRGATVTDLVSSSGIRVEEPADAAGLLSGLDLPASCCAVINHSIARRYRGGKPKTYLPLGTAADLLTPNLWTPTFVGVVTGAWDTFIAALLTTAKTGGAYLAHVNISYYSGSEPNPNPGSRLRREPTPRAVPVTEPIVASAMNSIPGSQRRRLRG